MASTKEVARLKTILRQEVTNFCASGRGILRSDARSTLQTFNEFGWRSVLFGGTLRSLLWSRVYRNRPGQPRDVDIVFQGVDIEVLRQRLDREVRETRGGLKLDRVVRETRFGGLKLERNAWQFDVWPLHATWMFSADEALEPDFEALPYTTAFNMEAVAVEVWPEKRGLPRVIFSGDDQFFKGIADQVIEINREENPFPELSVVRGLLLAQSLDFRVGERFASLISTLGPEMSDQDLVNLQTKHYGIVRQESDALRKLIQYVDAAKQKGHGFELRLPMMRQLNLFEEDIGNCRTLRAFALE